MKPIFSLAAIVALTVGLAACGDDETTTTVDLPPEVAPPVLAPSLITVTVTNLQPVDGLSLTPVFLGVHNCVYDMFNAGSPAPENIERLAEDGTVDQRIAVALSNGGVADAGALGGVLAPGESLSLDFVVDPADPLTQCLSYASMAIPSNDAFIGNDDPAAIPLFDAAGNLIERTGSSAFIVSGDRVWDSGTELNDEIPANTAALEQAAPDTGVDEGDVIRLHPGLQGSLAFGGPVGNVLLAQPNGDFTIPDIDMAAITIIEN